MSVEATLFVLRVVSGLVLLALLGALFVFLWRDYRSAAKGVEATRRTYGRLIALHQLDGDGAFALAGETYPLLPLTSLGRSPTNSVRIDDTFASGEHALLAMRNGQWWLEDRRSRNGTTLNGVPITQPVIVTDGDVIGIGSAFFRLEMEH